MLPILVDLQIIKIYTYGVFLVLGFFWSLFWFWRNLKRTSFKEEQMFDIVFLSMFGALFVSRLTYVALNFEQFGFSILRFILVNGYPGFSLVGALIGGFLTLAILSKVFNVPFLEVSAYTVPPLFIALTIGKIGAFFGGATVGTETSFFLSVQYVGYEGMRHITALYEALIFLAGFFVSQHLLMRYRRDSIHVGSILSFFIIVVALNMSLLDILKQDTLYLLSLRFNIIVPAIIGTGVLLLEVYKYRGIFIKSNGKKKQK